MQDGCYVPSTGEPTQQNSILLVWGVNIVTLIMKTVPSSGAGGQELKKNAFRWATIAHCSLGFHKCS